MTHVRPAAVAALVVFLTGNGTRTGAQKTDVYDYRVLATNKTSTMAKEMNAAAAAGFRFTSVMGGDTAIGGKEVVVAMTKPAGGAASHYEYRLLATNKTSTMQSEIQAAADLGYEYRAQTVFESMFGGQEVVIILERDRDIPPTRAFQYKLFATSRTSTMEKELRSAGELGYEVVGLTVGKTAIGGEEIVTIARRKVR
jgi:hypothetical protein